uniref:Uncharacterized protein n=1 Tax=Siphoviridae sp. ctr8v12 TaxID=2825685 RepID=A0A8S5QFW0_9CAUD|nr:MAG TPA: hypothetical protein [Siphoviridae sp. ctr8v12]
MLLRYCNTHLLCVCFDSISLPYRLLRRVTFKPTRTGYHLCLGQAVFILFPPVSCWWPGSRTPASSYHQYAP